MAYNELYKKAKNVNIFDVLSYYDIPVVNNKMVCIFHNDKDPSAHIYEDNNTGKCFGCDMFFDSISIVMKMENKDFVEALHFLNKNFSSSGNYIFAKKKNLEFYFKLCDELRKMVKDGADINIVKLYGEMMDLHSGEKEILIKLYSGLLERLRKEKDVS